MDEVVIATRRSALALAQARRVAELLEQAVPGVVTRLREVTTSGDGDRSSPVWALTEVGAFVRSVQAEVLAGRADLAVHSCKDLPVTGPDGLAVFYPERLEPWDALYGAALEDLGPRARVGTGSPRRTAQLSELRPDLDIAGIRGNVDTRLAAVDTGDYAAVVLAEAGLRRLGRPDAITHRFLVADMVPAPAQGALAVEARSGSRGAALAAGIDDAAVRLAVETERTLLELTGAGCRSALGVLAEVEDRAIHATGYVADACGARRAHVSGDDPKGTAGALAAELGL